MAKAKEIEGLNCAEDARTAAAAVLRARFAEIVELRGAALAGEEIEGVHAMRVATRRLRSALRDFAPLLKRRPLRKPKRDLKRIADALGAARDQDVAIVALEKLRAEADETIKESIGRLIDERRAERERAQLDLTETLGVSFLEDLQKRFETAVSEATTRKTSASDVSFHAAGRDVIGASAEEFCDLSGSLYEPSNEAGLHELRIAAKRLRYAVELFTACWGAPIAPFAAEIAEMQGFLGEVHDCDLWIADLGARLRRRAAEPHERRANAWLLSEFVKERTKNYRAALKLWSAWEETDFTGRLRAAISDSGADASPAAG